jgi:hypothetical protein
MRFVLATLAMLFASPLMTSAFAADITPGSTVKLLSDLPLRTEPPGGLFGLKGDRTGTSSANAQYKVLDTKKIMTIGGGQQWLKVEDQTDTNKTGWIYYGPLDTPTGNAVQVAR